MSAASAPQRPANGGVFARTVGSFVPRLTRKAFEKYGFSAAALITDWRAIVGADLASYTEPERLKWPKGVEAYAETEADDRGRPGAMLVLRVDGGRALDVQYRAGQIIERINAYFGYRAVADLRVVQAPITRQAARIAPLRREPEPIALPDVTSPALRAALERMAHGIVMRKSS
jgi:hypothetical protein